MKLKHAFVLLASVFLIVPIFALSMFVNSRYESYHRTNENFHATKVLSIALKEFESEFSKIGQIAGGFETNEFLSDYLSGDKEKEDVVSAVVDAVIDANEDIIQIAVYDVQGTLMPVSSAYMEGIYPSVSTSALESEIIENYGYTSINKYPLSSKTKNTFCYVFKIYDSNEFVGYGMFYFSLDMFEKIITEVNSSTEYTLLISDNKGKHYKIAFQ